MGRRDRTEGREQEYAHERGVAIHPLHSLLIPFEDVVYGSNDETSRDARTRPGSYGRIVCNGRIPTRLVIVDRSLVQSHFVGTAD